MHLGDLFDLSLIGRADSPALDIDTPEGLRTLTFGEIDARANRMARVLAARGVVGRRPRRPPPAPTASSSSTSFSPACDSASSSCRSTCCTASASSRTSSATPSRASSSPPRRRRRLSRRIAAGGRRRAGARRGARRRTTNQRRHIDGDAPLAIVYTSGTTGRAKGAVLTHDNFLANAVNVVTCWRITAADRYLAVLPLFHVHGLGNGLCSAGSRAAAACGWSSGSSTSSAVELVRDVPADAVLRRADDVRAPARDRRRGGARAIGETRAALRLRIGAAAGAGARGVSASGSVTRSSSATA